MVKRLVPFVVNPDRLIYSYLHTAAGSMEMAVDGSTPIEFIYTADEPTAVTSINLAVVDNLKELPDGFFTITALTNGVLVQVIDEDGTVLQHFGTDQAPIKMTADFENLTGGERFASEASPAASVHVVTLEIGKTGAELLLGPGQGFCMIIRDNLSALIQMRAQLQGYK